jgi:hypothetical protein
MFQTAGGVRSSIIERCSSQGSVKRVAVVMGGDDEEEEDGRSFKKGRVKGATIIIIDGNRAIAVLYKGNV